MLENSLKSWYIDRGRVRLVDEVRGRKSDNKAVIPDFPSENSRFV
jgi:hypothetical protein